jgi:hypothetical protein
MITIDARRCGAGKTRGENNNPQDSRSINYKINALIEDNEKVLVVLPGVNLIKEYKKQFPYATVIYSDIATNVSGELFESINNGDRLIIITHKAFLQQQIHIQTKQHYNLIIDEAFDPWKELTISSERKDIIFDWNEHALINDSFVDCDYFEIEFVDLATNNITCDSNIVRDLTNKNWLNYVKRKQYDELTSAGKKRVSVIQELHPYLLTGWSSVHLAAAAFDKTFLSWWMKKHEMAYSVIHPFIPHQTPIFMYYPDLGDGDGFNNSRNKKTTMPWVREQFNEFVASVSEPVLRLKNNVDQAGIFADEHCVKHNVAGINSYSHIQHVSLESSLNPSPEMTVWFNKQIDCACLPMNQKKDGLIYSARTGYLYYQVLMRSCLRNGQEASVFTLDSRAILAIIDYFDNYDFNEFKIHPPVQFGMKEKQKQKPLTSTERSQVKRYRANHLGCRNLTPREVLAKMKKKATFVL